MALATLSIDLVAKLANLEAGMTKATRIAEKQVALIEQRYAKLNQLASSLGVALGASLSVAGIASFIKSTNDGVLRLKDLSEASGASIANLSALENVARLAGGSLADVEGVLIKFNAVLKEAGANNAAGDALKAIGLQAEELRRVDPAEALRQVAVALQGYADDGNKARLVQELFGKSIREAGPLLKELAEAGQLNATVTAEQVEQADKFNKQIALFRTNIEDAGRAVTGVLVPALNRLFELWRSEGWAGVFGRSELRTNLAKSDAIKNAQDLVLRQLEIWQQRQQSGIDGADVRVAQLRTQLDGLRREALATSDAIKTAVGDDQALRAREDRGFVPTVQLPDSVGRAIGSRSQRAAPAKVYDDAKFMRERFAEQELAALAAYEKAEQEADARYLEFASTLSAIRDAREQQKSDFLRSEKDAYAQITDDTAEQVQQLNDVARDLGLTFQSAFEDAVLGGKELSEVLRGLGDDIARIFLRKTVTEPLANLLVGLLPNARGNVFGASGVVPFASGGVVSRPTMFAFGGAGRLGLMGEAGPEAILPLRRGRDGRLGVAGGGGVVLNQTINVQAGASRNEVALAMQTARQAAVSDLQDLMRRGRVMA